MVPYDIWSWNKFKVGISRRIIFGLLISGESYCEVPNKQGGGGLQKPLQWIKGIRDKEKCIIADHQIVKLFGVESIKVLFTNCTFRYFRPLFQNFGSLIIIGTCKSSGVEKIKQLTIFPTRLFGTPDYILTTLYSTMRAISIRMMNL